MTDNELITCARTGDNNSLDSLIGRYIPLVNKIARKYFLVGAGTDDLVQEGMIGLYKAYLGYKLDSQASFKTFASLCITRYIQTAVKLSNRDKNLPLNTYFSINNQGMVVISSGTKDDEDEGGIFISSTSLSPEESVIEEERLSEINQEIEKALSGYEKEVLKEYIEGHNYIEIAKVLDKEPKSIDNALNRIKIKLKFLRD